SNFFAGTSGVGGRLSCAGNLLGPFKGGEGRATDASSGLLDDASGVGDRPGETVFGTFSGGKGRGSDVSSSLLNKGPGVISRASTLSGTVSGGDVGLTVLCSVFFDERSGVAERVSPVGAALGTFESDVGGVVV